ncbi:MAG: hypothetical protein L6Q29_00285 [Candidatus Pacebacteria bacterium]|nr:hypothetical protein [Candidatus Paceibacterota bacterium]
MPVLIEVYGVLKTEEELRIEGRLNDMPSAISRDDIWLMVMPDAGRSLSGDRKPWIKITGDAFCTSKAREVLKPLGYRLLFVKAEE